MMRKIRIMLGRHCGEACNRADGRNASRGRAMVVRTALSVVTFISIAAHFLREDNFPLFALCLAAPLLLLVRQRWSPVILGGLAYAAAATWLWTAWDVVILRRALGQPWHRAAAILICVAAISVLAGALLHRGAIRDRFHARCSSTR